MPRYERILPLVGITLMGLGLVLLVERIHTLTFVMPLPRGFEARISIAWLILFFLLIVVAAGAESLHLSAEEEPLSLSSDRRRLRLHPASWVMPVLLTLTTFLFLRPLPNLTARSIGLIVAGLLLLTTLIVQYYRQDERSWVRTLSQRVLELLVYLTAFFLYGAIYSLRVRSLFSATSIVLLTFLLALELLRHLSPRGQALLPAAVVGLGLGEVTWALNYWAIGGLIGGSFLLVVLYVLVNLVSHQLKGSLTPRVGLEYGAVGLVGMVLIGLNMFFPGWWQWIYAWFGG